MLFSRLIILNLRLVIPKSSHKLVSPTMTHCLYYCDSRDSLGIVPPPQTFVRIRSIALTALHSCSIWDAGESDPRSGQSLLLVSATDHDDNAASKRIGRERNAVWPRCFPHAILPTAWVRSLLG